MVKIFLSHSTRDREWCEWLKASAEELNIRAYLAEHDVRPGTSLAEKVTREIDDSDAVIVLITDSSVTAPYVQQEIGYAVRAKKVVIPLVQPGIPVEHLGMLQGVEYIPFDFTAPHEGHARLRVALQRLVKQQTDATKQQRDVAVLVLACVALLFLAQGSQ